MNRQMRRTLAKLPQEERELYERLAERQAYKQEDRPVSTTVHIGVPTELQDIPEHPFWIASLNIPQNMVLQKLIRNADTKGFVTIDPGVMACELDLAHNKAAFNVIIGQLCDQGLLQVYRKSQREYKLMCAAIKAAYYQRQKTEEVATGMTLAKIPMPTTNVPGLQECWDEWSARFGEITGQEAETIREQYKAILAKGFDAKTWVMEAIQLTSKKTVERHTINFFVGVIRQWMVMGYGYVPTQEEKDFWETVEEMTGIPLTDAAKRYYSKLLAQYGLFKVLKTFLTRTSDIKQSIDMSLVAAETLATIMVQTTGQPLAFRKEND